MATAATRHRLHHHLRRVLSLSSHHHHHTLSTTKPLSSLLNKKTLASFQTPSCHRLFHCTNPSMAQTRSNFNDMDKIDPDTILFEGCDYKHWLIVMDFGKDPQQRPPPEQMVETYVQTLAKVLGSVEEAKKKIYACSTTTYTGFQAEIDEETSNKLEGLPGVIFVLPDSYIDPVNKEYGGDKYINGTIIPRPPPVQYGRMRRDRQTDQRSRGPMPNQGGNYAYNQNGPRSGEGRGYMPQRENFGEGGRNNPVSDNTHYSNERNNPQRGNYNQGMPSYPGNYNHGVPSNQGNFNHGLPSNQGNFNHGVPSNQGNFNHGTPSNQGNFNHGVPTPQGNYNQGYNQGQRMENPGNHGGYVPHGQVNNPQGEYGYNNSQGHFGNVHENHGGTAPRGQTGYPPVSGADGQSDAGYFQRGPGGYAQGQNGNFRDGGRLGYGPGYTSQGGDQNFSQAPENVNTVHSGHGNYSPPDQSGMNQRRF